MLTEVHRSAERSDRKDVDDVARVANLISPLWRKRGRLARRTRSGPGDGAPTRCCRPQLRRIAEHQQRTFERIRSRPSSASTIEHSSITISFAFDAGASSHSSKLGCSTPDSARAIDQRVDRRTALVAARLVRNPSAALPVMKGCEFHFAIDAVGDVPRQRGGLAGFPA